MADHQSQDVDSRLVQSVVDRTTDVDGNSPNSIQNLGGGKGDATDSTNVSAPNASKLSESSNKQTSIDTPTTSGVTESSKSTETGDDNAKQTETGDEQSRDAESGGEAPQSGGGLNDTLSKKDGDKQQVARSASVKKPALKSMSLNKAFLSSTGGSTTQAGSKLLSSQQAGSPSISAAKPRLISKIGSMSTGRVGVIGSGRGAGQPVWNKNMPVPQPDSKKMSDEELQAQLGIHLTARLGADDPSNKEANWADIDDEEWNPPEEIEWNDGTKIALPQHEELPATTEPPTTDNTATSSSPKPSSTLVLSTSSMSSTSDRRDTDRPQEPMQPPPPRAGPWAPVHPGPFPYPQPTVNNQPYHHHHQQQHHFSGRPGGPGGPGGPPGGMPPSMQQHHQSQPYRPRQFDQRGPPPPPFGRQLDPRQQLHQPPPPPQGKEVPPDDFNRSWRDRQSAQSRELFNSETGKLEPVDEMNRNRNMIPRNGRPDMGPSKPPMSVLQRQQPLSPSTQGPLSSGEPSPGFPPQQQQHHPPRFDMDPRRRRASSNVSMGSNNGRRMSFPRNEILHPEVFSRDEELQQNQSPTQSPNISQTAQPKSPIPQKSTPEISHAQPNTAVYQPPSAGGRGVYHPPSASVQHPVNTGPDDSAVEDPLALQERVMKESREQARKRREEREKAEEEAKQARIQKKLAELSKNEQPKPEEQVKETPQEAASEPPKDVSNTEAPKDAEPAPTTAALATTSTENHIKESNWRATAQSSSEADRDQRRSNQQSTKPSEPYRPSQPVYRPPAERRSASPAKDPKEQPWRLNTQSNQGTASQQPTWSGKPQHQQSNPWGPVAGEKPRFPPIDGLGHKSYESSPPAPSQFAASTPPVVPSQEIQEPRDRDLPNNGGSKQQEADSRVQDKWRRSATRDTVDQDQPPTETPKPVSSASQPQQSSQTRPIDPLPVDRQQQQGPPHITSTTQPPRDNRHDMSRSLNMAAAHDHNQRRGFNQGGRPGPQHQQGLPRDPRGRPLLNWNAGGEDPHARWRNPDQLMVQQPRKPAEQPKPRSPSISQETEAKPTAEEPESVSIDSTWRKVEVDQFGNRKFVKAPLPGPSQTNMGSPETKPSSLAPQPSVSLPPPPPSQPMSMPYSPQGRHAAPIHAAPMQYPAQSHHSQQPPPQQMMANVVRGPGQSPPDSSSMAPLSSQSGGMHQQQQQHPGLQQHSPNIGPPVGPPARPRYFPAGGAALIQQHLGMQQGPESVTHNAVEPALHSPQHGSMQLPHGVSAANRSPTLQHAHLHGHNQRGPSPSRASRPGHAHRPSDGPTSPRLQSSMTAFEMVQSKILGLVNKTPKTASHSTSSATETSEPEYIVTSGDTADLFVDESALVTTSKPAFDEPTVPVRVTVSLPGSRKQEPLEPEPLVEEDSQTRPTEEELFGELFPRDFGSLPHVRFPTAIPQALKRPAPQFDNNKGKRRVGNLHVQPQAIPTELTIARDYNAMKRPIMTVKLGPDSERKEVVMQAGQHLNPHSQLQQQQQHLQPPPQQQQQGRNGNGNRRQSSSGRGGSGGEWRGGRGGNSYKGGNRDGRSSPAGGYNHNSHHGNNNNNNNNGNNGGQGNNGFNYRNQGSIRGMPRKLASPVQ